jgi:hypothetical protein
LLFQEIFPNLLKTKELQGWHFLIFVFLRLVNDYKDSEFAQEIRSEKNTVRLGYLSLISKQTKRKLAFSNRKATDNSEREHETKKSKTGTNWFNNRRTENSLDLLEVKIGDSIMDLEFSTDRLVLWIIVLL